MHRASFSRSTIGQKEVNGDAGIRILQPAVYVHRERNLEIVAHVDDFLCAGRKDLDWFREGLTAFFDNSATYFGPEDEHTKYLNRVLNIVWH